MRVVTLCKNRNWKQEKLNKIQILPLKCYSFVRDYYVCFGCNLRIKMLCLPKHQLQKSRYTKYIYRLIGAGFIITQTMFDLQKVKDLRTKKNLPPSSFFKPPKSLNKLDPGRMPGRKTWNRLKGGLWPRRSLNWILKTNVPKGGSASVFKGISFWIRFEFFRIAPAL